MRTAVGALVALVVAMLDVACASSPPAEGKQRQDRDVITQQQMLEGGFTNLYDAVLALRANWLSPRGRDSFASPSQVWVYVDNTRAGGIDRLRLLQPSVVSSVRFFEGTEAQGRWGVGHSAGVILVSTWSTDREGLPTPPPPQDSQPDSSARVSSYVAPSGAPPDTPSAVPSGSPYVSPVAGAGRFALAAGGRAAPIHVSASDHAGVLRVAGDLRADVGRVTGTEPRLVIGDAPAAPRVVLVGTLGRSAAIDRLVRLGKVDTGGVAGRWETFLVQVVDRPSPGVEQALVVAGSDERGTIFGVYDLSGEIGVSPWYWWADVPVARQPGLHVLPGRHTDGTPAVRYRGIFINDEAPALAGWAREKFGGFDHRFYGKVFELVLRLKGNYLWPAMWGSAFAVDDTLNAKLADDYGIVMGTSHHEPMTRAHAEWAKFGRGPWDYTRNDSALRAFWREGIRRMGRRENVVTLGMRGDGDEPMTEGTATALLERIVADQRRIIAEETGRPAADTPQLWALYKEVQDYYDAGMRVPDDVTLLFSDDNWGNIRRLPGAKDRGRAGGFGVYYHFDYVGGPRNYKWINTNQIARVWEQMHLAHRLGADRIWIVNVGDIKPMELPTEFFLDLAWRPDRVPADSLPAWTRAWAARQFPSLRSGQVPSLRSGQVPSLRSGQVPSLRSGQAPPAWAAEIADVLTTYMRLVARRKPELLDTATYSLAHYREAETVVAEHAALAERARRLWRELPPAYRDAYYQLVLHPVEASANLHDLYVTVARNRLYARQGRSATNALAERARRLFARDAEISRYYNDTLAGGKWSHMMDQTHIGYTSWQQPPRDVMPRVEEITVPERGELGVAVEGQLHPVTMHGVPPRGTNASPEPAAELPEIDAFNRQGRWIEVYDRGRSAVDYAVTSAEPWVRVSSPRGSVDRERRLWVTVDWERAPTGRHRVPLTVTGSGGRATVHAVVHNPAAPRRDDVAGFVEGSGYVAMEAEHYARAVSTRGVAWQRIPDLGRTLSAMTPFPVTAPSQSPGGDSPRLEYRLHTFGSGAVTVRAHLAPTLNFTGGSGLRYAVSFDDETPQVVNVHADGWSSGKTDGNRPWERAVADNIKVLESRHVLAAPGAHVLKYWMVDPGLVLQRIVVDLGGVEPSYLGPPESWHRPVRPPSAAAVTRAPASPAGAHRP